MGNASMPGGESAVAAESCHLADTGLAVAAGGPGAWANGGLRYRRLRWEAQVAPEREMHGLAEGAVSRAKQRR